MPQQQPRSVTGAIWLLVALMAVTGVAALLTLVFKDQLIDAWAADRADDGSVEPPAFVAVAIVMFIVVASLSGVLLQFFRYGYHWARVALTGVGAGLALATLACLRTGQPAIFVVASVVVLVLDAAFVVCLWHRDTSAYVGREPDPIADPVAAPSHSGTPEPRP
jgi:hypothetical protein